MGVMLFSSIFIVWLVALFLLLPVPKKVNTYKSFNTYNLAQILGYEKVKEEAESFGWSLNTKEFIQIAVAALGVGLLVSLLTGNIFFIIVGIVLSFSLPRFIVIKIKKQRRISILLELPDNLKLLTSKLMDYSSVQLALKSAIEDMDGQTKHIFRKMYQSLEINMPLETVLSEAIAQIRIQKFNDFAEKLIMANSEGFHEESIKSLKETIENMSDDIKEIKKLEIKSKSEKKKIYIAIAGSWLMPFILAGLSSDNANVFLSSLHGKIFIVSFFVATLYVIGKGDDYLSLNLDEL
jgi:Flp pilus assembly protein TadB